MIRFDVNIAISFLIKGTKKGPKTPTQPSKTNDKHNRNQHYVEHSNKIKKTHKPIQL